ncbi:MAG: glycosyltransferase [Acetobacterales bacterium]
MHVLFLASVMPNLGHSQAAETVCAALMCAMRERGHDVSFATVASGREPHADSMERFAEVGIRYVGDFTHDVQDDPASDWPRLRRWASYVAEFARIDAAPDYPRFRDPERTARALTAGSPNVALLFWDSWFEHLLPAFHALPVAAYLGRPRTEASLVRLADAPSTPNNMLMRHRLLGRRRRHLRRMRQLKAVANICAVDAAWYRAHDVPCRYVPNCWPDAFGPNWKDRRRRAEGERKQGDILGNVGHLGATGNDYGLAWMGREVVPSLDRRMVQGDWRINVCGPGTLTARASEALRHPNVAVRGFVPDIDEEMLSNRLFLICNNAGPYTGGYTRVCYAMASGAPVVAHRALAESMPEVGQGENACLGVTGDELAAHIAGLLHDTVVRERVGDAARATYERHYAPSAVAASLEAMLEAAA